MWGVAGISRLQKVKQLGSCLPSGATTSILLAGDPAVPLSGPGPGSVWTSVPAACLWGEIFARVEFWALSV